MAGPKPITERLVFRGSRPEVIPCERPTQLQPGHLLLRPTHLIMGSIERRILRGEIPFSGTLGREALLSVEAVGPGVPTEMVGKRVVVEAFVACSNCDHCRGGTRHLCQARVAPGLSSADGLASAWVTLPSTSIVEVPPSMKAETAALAQSVAAALHAVRTGLVDARGYVTVLGDGPMAMLTARVALSLNASVRLLGKHPDRFTLCERMGIKHRHIAEAGKRHDQQVVLDCTGDTSADGLSTAAGLAAPRSRIVVKAPPVPIPGRDVPISSASLKLAAASEVTIVGAAAGQLREGLGWLQKNKLDESIVLSRRFPWSRAIEGLDALHDRRVLMCVIEMP